MLVSRSFPDVPISGFGITGIQNPQASTRGLFAIYGLLKTATEQFWKLYVIHNGIFMAAIANLPRNFPENARVLDNWGRKP